MKKISLAFIAFCCCFYVNAQNVPATTSAERPIAASPVQFGIKAGVNLANIKSKLYNDPQARMGFHAGALVHIHISDHIGVQPEIMYSSQGFEQDITSNLSVEAKINYINIPVLLQYMNSGFRLETGPQVGFLTSAEVEYSDDTEDDLKEYIKTTDFSWVFGASYLSNLGLGVYARYNLGITNINEKITVAGVADDDINHRVWQFGLFYQFRR